MVKHEVSLAKATLSYIGRVSNILCRHFGKTSQSVLVTDQKLLIINPVKGRIGI